MACVGRPRQRRKHSAMGGRTRSRMGQGDLQTKYHQMHKIHVKPMNKSGTKSRKLALTCTKLLRKF